MATAAVDRVERASLVGTYAGLTARDLLAKAQELRPRLRAMEEEAERQGRLPQDLMEELDAAGFFRIVQPRNFGGLEFDVPTFYKVMMELARGSTDVGWVMALVSGQPMVLARFPEQAQFEAYGATGEFRASGSFAPPGKAVPVPGGYRVTAAWQNGSGCDISTHFMPLVMIEAKEGPQPAQILIDRKDFEIVDDWNVIGMRGTGSKRVIVNDLFVPEHRVMRCHGMMRGAEPLDLACKTNDNPMYSSALSPFLVSQTACVAVGTARAALDHYEEILRTKKSAYPPYREKCTDPVHQRNYGTAFRLVSTAEAALVQAGHEFMDYAREVRDGVEFDPMRALRLRSIAVHSVQLGWEAFQLIFHAGGTSTAAREGHPLTRILRNLNVLRTHAVLQLEDVAHAVGRTAFAEAN
ncbi:acyl-CoA dehydrogenase family protein [Novosphingobium jiangmenense]|uniref:Acyl-CoA dehydrogenase family protein n=1 Tax=Novosphingobium jiangmenense TaxID=2791981 RepID=A0ABS0HBB8_9SPHN|nr:acyl-CoA dehydrogenase family protein [Novosphingobium jiangmenense]MBF9149581.1 acyl-CoA dehydrogenase family protein [Novosphingobium jiangmenense]